MSKACKSTDLRRSSRHLTWDRHDGPSRPSIALLVPKTLVKKIKNALEAHGYLDKSVKIRPAGLEEQKGCVEGASTEPRPKICLIPTNLSAALEGIDQDIFPVKRDLLRFLGLEDCAAEISLIRCEQARDTDGFLGSEGGRKDGLGYREISVTETSGMNPLARTIDRWLHQLPREGPGRLFARGFVLSYSWTYMVYPPLLLLPLTALSNLSSIFACKGRPLPEDLSPLWCLLSREFKTSHIALNAPIPASASREASFPAKEHPEANIRRSPTSLTPLYGDFGPALPLDHVPTIAEFSSAIWCTARQNGIFQTWAPRYTMFSRGNISEKARILRLETLTEQQLGSPPTETSAVDLYAGIGYFAFSYAQAGVGKVLCWEINPWSVEGLRRGAKRNGWGVGIIADVQSSHETIKEEGRLIIFQESNEHAARRVAAMKHSIPPIRHVNCGLLPSSKESWEVAVQVLDPTGGWIHAHENIAKADIESRKEEIVETFKQLVEKRWVQQFELDREVKCEHVEQVKSYAPGIMHCVLDISVSLTGRA